MTSFAIVRYNHQTYRSGGVVAVVILLDFDGSLAAQDRRQGWSYFLEETDLAPGIEADKATKIRQAWLDRADSKTM